MQMAISRITKEDVPALLELIRELARFEKLEHEVEATVESLSESFFGPQPVAGALFARADGHLAGYSIYFFTFSSFTGRPGIWLEDLYVRPQFRQQGLGRAMMQAVARIGAERDCRRYEWTALAWNKNALEFYAKLGGRTLDEWVFIRLDAQALQRAAGARERG